MRAFTALLFCLLLLNLRHAISVPVDIDLEDYNMLRKGMENDARDFQNEAENYRRGGDRLCALRNSVGRCTKWLPVGFWFSGKKK